MSVFVGMLGVAAMATQNALVRLDLVGFPSTAVVTTNTVQLTDRSRRSGLRPRRSRVSRACPSSRKVDSSLCGGIRRGLGAGGFLEIHFGLWGLIFPVVLAAPGVPLSEVLGN
jgi:hypothetical protein